MSVVLKETEEEGSLRLQRKLRIKKVVDVESPGGAIPNLEATLTRRGRKPVQTPKSRSAGAMVAHYSPIYRLAEK